MYESESRTLINNSPTYIRTLIASDYIHCNVTTDSPSLQGEPVLAYTNFDEKNKRWVVHFRPEAVTLSPAAQALLWRHEIGHIFLAHFSQEPCNPDNPYRSHIERLQVGDLQINYYLLQEKSNLEEVGALAKKLVEDHTGESVPGPGFLNPETIYPEVGLALQEYPYEIIHAYVHQNMDEQQDAMQQMMEGLCGGISEAPDGVGAATAAVIAGVAAEGEADLGNRSFGNISGNHEIRLRENDLPTWIAPLEAFARSIVDVVLADKRSHTRPQEVYRAYDVHIPTSRPRWAYKAAQVCLLVDTSGSMGDDLKYVMPVVAYLNQHEISVRLIAGDTYVTTDELIIPGSKLPTSVKGGGGTEITPLFDRADDYEPASIVCFTDGYVPRWPKDPGVPTLWVGTQVEPPYGQHCT